jgi:hypothetical protein
VVVGFQGAPTSFNQVSSWKRGRVNASWEKYFIPERPAERAC